MSSPSSSRWPSCLRRSIRDRDLLGGWHRARTGCILTVSPTPPLPDAESRHGFGARSRVCAYAASGGLIFIVVVAVSALAVWIMSPRLTIDGPSLVDDWSAISASPHQVSRLVRLENPEVGRFRPSSIAWNDLQWHTFDAPRGLVGPRAWNFLRLLVFVTGMTVMTALMLPRARGSRETIIHAALAGLPAFAVVTVPKFATDFARFGPQEPLLLGGLALGGALLAVTARLLLASAPIRPVPVASAAVGGSFFWLLGVYQKEVALSAIPLVAAALYAGRSHLGSWRRVSRKRRRALVALGVVVALPLVHMAVEVIRISLRGDVVYETDVGDGARIARGLRVLYDWSHEAMPLNSRYLMVVSVVLVVVVAAVRRKIDVLAVGALASGALSIVFAAQTEVVATRYYIPIYALFIVALSLSLAQLPTLVQAAGVLLVFFAFMPPYEPRAEVSRWSAEEQQQTKIVSLVADLHRSGCTVAVQSLDPETSLALPVLVKLHTTVTERHCIPRGAYFVLPAYPPPSLSLLRVCVRRRLEPIELGRSLGVYSCGQLRTGLIRDPDLGLVRPHQLLAAYRFPSAVKR